MAHQHDDNSTPLRDGARLRESDADPLDGVLALTALARLLGRQTAREALNAAAAGHAPHTEAPFLGLGLSLAYQGTGTNG